MEFVLAICYSLTILEIIAIFYGFLIKIFYFFRRHKKYDLKRFILKTLKYWFIACIFVLLINQFFKLYGF